MDRVTIHPLKTIPLKHYVGSLGRVQGTPYPNIKLSLDIHQYLLPAVVLSEQCSPGISCPYPGYSQTGLILKFMRNCPQRHFGSFNWCRMPSPETAASKHRVDGPCYAYFGSAKLVANFFQMQFKRFFYGSKPLNDFGTRILEGLSSPA